ncbi:MAG: endonuclease III [bacterium]|nr:endonuclease III [bacterium]
MKRAEKASRILTMLDELYPEPPIPLDHEDPFTLLVAVALSAQTTDERVNQVTPGLFARARTPAEMAKLTEKQILAEIRSCGLAPGKAKNLRAMSEILVRDHGGAVPADMEALEALPGVGHKTASVVLIQAFDTPAFPVDTHIHRLAARWGLSDGKSVEKTERDLKAVFPREAWSRLHLSMIYFGREYCPARGHDLSTCPICGWAASKKRMAEEASAGGGGPRSRAAVAGRKAAKNAAGKRAGKKKAAKKRAR